MLLWAGAVLTLGHSAEALAAEGFTLAPVLSHGIEERDGVKFLRVDISLVVDDRIIDMRGKDAADEAAVGPNGENVRRLAFEVYWAFGDHWGGNLRALKWRQTKKLELVLVAAGGAAASIDLANEVGCWQIDGEFPLFREHIVGIVPGVDGDGDHVVADFAAPGDGKDVRFARAIAATDKQDGARVKNRLFA